MRFERIGWGDLAESIRRCSKGEAPRRCAVCGVPYYNYWFSSEPRVLAFLLSCSEEGPYNPLTPLSESEKTLRN